MSKEYEGYEVSPELIAELSEKAGRESRRIGRRIARILSIVHRVGEILRDSPINDARIRRISGRYDRPITCYAVDSSYRSALPLVFGDLFIVVGGYVRYPRANADTSINRGLKIILRCRTELTSRIQSAIARLLERRISLRLLTDKKYSVHRWNTLIFDGPIVPLWPIILFTSRLYKPERRLVRITKKIIRRSQRRKKTLLGVIKRIRTHFIGRGILKVAVEEGLISKVSRSVIRTLENTNDKALATLILRPGEALIIGTYGSSRIIKESLVKAGKWSSFEEFMNNNRWIRNVSTVFLKPKRSKHVVRLEILDYNGLGMDNILSWVNENSSHTACPFVLDIVDRYTSLSSIIYELARKLMIRRTTESIAAILRRTDLEKVDLLLELADLQKKYVPTMG